MIFSRIYIIFQFLFTKTLYFYGEYLIILSKRLTKNRNGQDRPEMSVWN